MDSKLNKLLKKKYGLSEDELQELIKEEQDQPEEEKEEKTEEKPQDKKEKVEEKKEEQPKVEEKKEEKAETTKEKEEQPTLEQKYEEILKGMNSQIEKLNERLEKATGNFGGRQTASSTKGDTEDKNDLDSLYQKHKIREY